MTVEYLRYTIGHRRSEGFQVAYAEAAAILQAEPRCLSYELSQSLTEPTRFLVRIEWAHGRRRLEDFRNDAHSPTSSA